jgi:hypothetical protein
MQRTTSMSTALFRGYPRLQGEGRFKQSTGVCRLNEAWQACHATQLLGASGVSELASLWYAHIPCLRRSFACPLNRSRAQSGQAAAASTALPQCTHGRAT